MTTRYSPTESIPAGQEVPALFGEFLSRLEESPTQCPPFVVREALVPALRATTKEGVIREMVESLRAAGSLPGDTETIVQAVLLRERLGSTGIGQGLAIPHAKHASIARLLGTVALSRPGIAFQAMDDQPAHVFVLLLSPLDQPWIHLRALEYVCRCLGDRQLVRRLLAAG